MGILWILEDSLEILWEIDGDSMGILWGFYEILIDS